MDRYVIALDQGTTSSRAILMDKDAAIVGLAQRELPQIYPQAGWVEHNPMDIWASQRSVLTEVLAKTGVSAEQIVSIGITNQRETTIVWDKESGQPIYNAIVWQCRRTKSICEQLQENGLQEYIKQNTGLMIDPYFSATKLKWILDNVADCRKRAHQGKLLFGTVDSWLLWKLTDGKVHATDCTNASRTMLFNIHENKWDKNILQALDIPESMLPDVYPNDKHYGLVYLDGSKGHAVSVPITAIAGDQHSALFGQQCFQKGSIKNTYGTGCFMLMNTGFEPISSQHGLLTTIGFHFDKQIYYALEGSIFMGGATLQWLRDELGLVRDTKDTEYYATKVKDSDGVYLVPAFSGLGAPYWDSQTRGVLLGLNRSTNRNHIIRASLEAIAYQTLDLALAMEQDSQLTIDSIHADGGAAANNFLMQYQADILGKKVFRSAITETTAYGIGLMAGLSSGFWDDLQQINQKQTNYDEFAPAISQQEREDCYQKWLRAIECARKWKV